MRRAIAAVNTARGEPSKDATVDCDFSCRDSGVPILSVLEVIGRQSLHVSRPRFELVIPGVGERHRSLTVGLH